MLIESHFRLVAEADVGFDDLVVTIAIVTTGRAFLAEQSLRPHAGDAWNRSVARVRLSEQRDWGA